MGTAATVTPPKTLPANFSSWDAPAAPPSTLPADFNGWDAPKSAPAKAEPEGFFHSFADATGLSALRHPIDNGIAAAKAVGRSIVNPYDPEGAYIKTVAPMVENAVDQGKQAVSMAKHGSYGAAVSHALLATPVLGQGMQRAMDQTEGDQGSYGKNLKSLMTNPGAMGTLAGTAAVMADPAARGFSRIPGGPAALSAASDAIPTAIASPINAIAHPVAPLKRMISGDITAPSSGGISPLDRYNSAKNLGVSLDAADATGSPVLKGVKQFNQNSLLGGGTYDKARVSNANALNQFTNQFLTDLYDGDRESGGAQIQQALKSNQQGLRSNAEDGFQQLTDQTKGKPMVGSPAVGAKAQSLLDSITPLAQKYPSLAPSKTMSVLSDLSGVGSTPAPKPMSFLDAPGSEFAVPRSVSSPKLDTFADLQRLRSATHDLTTANPDLVKSQAIAPLQQMTGSIDDAMTNAANGLTPEQTQTFRDANAHWADMKGTYDDPSSSLYHAVRTDTPSTLYGGNGLGPKTPEAVRDLLPRLNPQATGALRRGVVEGALKTTNDGSPNFKTFGSQLNRIPADYRSELFTTPQNESLRDLNHVTNLLGEDANPSGSAKLGQKILEGSALAASPFHPVGAIAPLAQYPIAKLMNSPGFVDWLMRGKASPVTQLPLGVAAPALAASGINRQVGGPYD